MNKFHKDFFIILGYLSSPIRITKLDIETALNTQSSVQSKYQKLAGSQLIIGNNFYHWPVGTNKWGSELRIYFNSNRNIPASLAAMVVKPRFSQGKYNARINNNDFVWDLIEFGFTASDTQNSNRISSMVPIQKMNDYKTGFNL